MIKNLKLNKKIILIPIVATIFFIVYFLVIAVINQQNGKILKRISDDYTRSWEFSQDLLSGLELIHANFIHARFPEDIKRVEEAESIYNSYLNKLESFLINPRWQSQEFEDFKNKFQEYFQFAKEVTLETIEGESGEKLDQSLEGRLQQYKELKKLLMLQITQSKNDMTTGFRYWCNLFNHLLYYSIGYKTIKYCC